MTSPGGEERAWIEAQQRGFWANLVEGIARGALPSMVTPELMIEAPELRDKGLNLDGLIALDALAQEMRSLLSEEGAKMMTTPDGQKVSTEGDMEATTEYLNRYYGTKMYTAAFLSMPTTYVDHLGSMTLSGLKHVEDNELAYQDLPNSAALLMPDFSNVQNNEEYSFEARDASLERGDAFYYEPAEYPSVINKTLLEMRNNQIDNEANRMFGLDDDLESEEKVPKKAWVAAEKERAKARIGLSDYDPSTHEKTFTELLSWSQMDWTKYDLTPEESATVSGVLWYLKVRTQATEYVVRGGGSKLTAVGQSERTKEIATTARNDVMRIVEQRISENIQHGADMGNFIYLWERYFWDELNKVEAPDPLEELARVSNLSGELELEDANR
jgi:hypothetical protein